MDHAEKAQSYVAYVPALAGSLPNFYFSLSLWVHGNWGENEIKSYHFKDVVAFDM